MNFQNLGKQTKQPTFFLFLVIISICYGDGRVMDTVSLKDPLSRRTAVVRLAGSSMDAGTGVEETVPP